MGEIVKLPEVDGRECFPEMLENLGLSGTYVEVGADQLENAKCYLFNLRKEKFKRFVGIDPYDYKTHYSACSQEKMEELYRGVKKVARDNFGLEILRMKSVEAAVKFTDESVDFVYIDGLHLYDDVMSDLRVWFPKIKKGGVLAGHDIHMDEVRFAVMRFLKGVGLEYQRVKREADPSWYVWKK